MLTADRIRKMLTYEESTGTLVWREKPGRNSSVVGQQAGASHNGYIRLKIDGKSHYAHRLIWLLVHGVWPASSIDHIDGDGANNRLTNLRLVTVAQNKQNLRRARSDSKTGMLGVSARGRKWRAQIYIDGKQTHLGSFETAAEASEAYIAAKRIHHPWGTI